MTQPLLIYGASYPDILHLIDDINAEQTRWEVLGFIDDQSTDSEFTGYPVLGNQDLLTQRAYRHCLVVNNVYSRPIHRMTVTQTIRSLGKPAPSLIHPGIRVARSQLANEGIVAMAGAQIGSLSTLGEYCVLRFNSIVNHHNQIGSFAFIGPGATLCGHVTVGHQAYIGAGAVIREHLHIGDHALVGMGSVVVKSVPAGATVCGNPARTNPA